MKEIITRKWYILLSTIILCGCSSSEKDENKSVIDFEISQIIDVTESSAIINFTLNSSGKEDIQSRGICIAMETNPTINDIKYEEHGNVLGQYTTKFENLQFNTKYHARPYIITDSKTIYGNELSFTTKNVNIPTIITSTISSILQTSAVSGGKIESDGSSKITAKGVCWSKITNIPTVVNAKTIDNTDNGTFTSSLTSLEQNTTYYVRAYATNVAGIGYGQVISFTTSSYVLPIVTTSPISTIAETTGIGGGTVVSEGSNPVIERGLCWSTAPNPTISYPKTRDGSGVGSFVSNLYSLQPFKTYYIRAYATSTAGTAYGENVTIKTLGGDKPTVTASGSASGLSAYATVTVKTQGSDNIIKISVSCFDMDGNRVGIVSGGGWSNTNVFAPVNFEISGLSRNTKYYIVGYATNGVGTGTSEKSYFSTL